MESSIFLKGVCGVLLVGGATLGVADTLHLHNGGTLSGVVLEERADEIVFKQGSGRMVFPRKSIATVAYDSVQKNTAQLDAWRQRYFYTEEYAPDDLAELSADFRELKKVRESALLAKRRGKVWASKGRSAEARGVRLQKKQLALREALSELDPVVKQHVSRRNALTSEINRIVLKANQSSGSTREEWIQEQMILRREWQSVSKETNLYTAKHSSLVSAINKTIAEQHQTQEQIQQSQKEQSRVSTQMLPYVNAVEVVRSSLRRDGTPDNRAEYPLYFCRIDEELARMVKDLKTETVSLAKSGEVLLVNALLNGTVDATLILDTGASSTTISKALATRLGIVLEEETAGFSTMADGRLVPTTFITLDSIQVGSAVRQEVSASVLENAPSPGVDGLLGMTFLKNFIIQLDIEKNQVELIHLVEDP